MQANRVGQERVACTGGPTDFDHRFIYPRQLPPHNSIFVFFRLSSIGCLRGCPSWSDPLAWSLCWSSLSFGQRDSGLLGRHVGVDLCGGRVQWQESQKHVKIVSECHSTKASINGNVGFSSFCGQIWICCESSRTWYLVRNFLNREKVLRKPSRNDPS